MPEPLQPSPGITEHTNPDGTKILFFPSPFEKDWELHAVGTTMTYQEARVCAAGILTRSFINSTISAMDPSYNNRPPNVCNATLAQIGKKNAIYRADIGNTHSFILVLSKGTPQLNRETQEDFRNLHSLRMKLDQRHLFPFVAQPYALAEYNGIPGFSAEYLKNHLELRYVIGITGDGKSYTFFEMNAEGAKADRFNRQFTLPLATNTAPVKTIEVPSSPHYIIKKEMIARLYVMFRLMGAVPAEFSVNAGDFMADPDERDLDLRLITIRGGLRRLPRFSDFTSWLYNYGSIEPVKIDHSDTQVNVPLFNQNQKLIAQGITRGIQLLRPR